MKFVLPEQDAAALINVLGQLPTNSGVYPTLASLVEQFKANQAAEAKAVEAKAVKAEEKKDD